jgi:hypothetical protein
VKLKHWCGVCGENGLRGALVLGFSMFSWCCVADEPLRPPSKHEICSSKKSACVEFTPGTYGIVRTRGESGEWIVGNWHVPGWHRWGLLTNNGSVFVSCWTGGLVGLEPKETESVVGIFSADGRGATIQLGQVVDSLKQLRRTVSHFYWGTCSGFDETEKSLLIESVSGKYSVSLATLEVKKL